MTRFTHLVLFLLPSCFALAGEAALPIDTSRLSPELSAEYAPARQAVAAAVADLGIAPADIAPIYVSRSYQSRNNGVTHFVFRQQVEQSDIANAVYVVNVGPDGNVLNSGGQLFARPKMQPADRTSVARDSVRRAVAAVNPALGERYAAIETAGSGKGARFAAAGLGDEVTATPGWFPVRGTVIPVWIFQVVDEDKLHAYAVMVDPSSGVVVAKRSLTHFDSAAGARGLVFEQGSPQPNPTPGVLPTTPLAFVERTVQPFTGDPVASPEGWVDGAQTVGNNVVAGTNPRGKLCVTGMGNCLYPPDPVTAADGNFSFPLEIGPSAPPPTLYPDAVVTNAFYWVNKAHDMFYALGFDEASGNFQERNFGRGGAEGDAMYLYVQYGSAATGAPVLNNSSFIGSQPGDDGTRAVVRFYVNTLNGYVTDDGLDAGVIIHEYTHGVTYRLVQDLYYTFQGAAMAEAWCDFFGLEFLTPNGAPVDGSYEVGTYAFGSGAVRTRPYSTSLDANPLTFANYGHVLYLPEVHSDGEIWMEALWEVRAALIRQFGETEGRRRARMIALDSLKLSVPSPSMIDARDAILLADRVDFAGESQDTLWAAFARRGFGVLAQSDSGNSMHISPSFDLPSKTGAIGFYDDTVVIGEPVRIVLYDGNLAGKSATVQFTTSSGDLETIQLRKRGSAFYGYIWTTYPTVFRNDGALEVVPDDVISAYYKDEDTGGGWKLIDHQQKTTPGYSGYLANPRAPQFSGEVATSLSSSSEAASFRTLPFEFPFYGKTYKSLWISSYGVVTFDGPNTQACTDGAALASLKGIAALFMPLVTSGYAQDGEGVYVSQTADTYSIRWAGETSLANPYADPDPVNFSLTLHRDGQIDFQYGEGNRSLTSVAGAAGCPVGTATVGVSNGNEGYPQLSGTLDGSGSLENALSLMYIPPYPQVGVPIISLESPVEGDTAHGFLTGKGIVYDVDENTPIRRMDVLVDGIAVAPASVNGLRSDYCATNKVNGCPYVGFTFAVSTSYLNMAPGTHTLQLRATNARGVTNTYPDTPLNFNVEEGQSTQPVAAVETIASGDTISGYKSIRGYAGLPDARIRNLDVLVDGITYGAATYGLSRGDVCSTLPKGTTLLDCPRIGFSFTLDTAVQDPLTTSLPNGAHKLQLRITDQYNRSFVFPTDPISFTVDNAANRPPVIVLETPVQGQELSGTVKLTGYAYDPDGIVYGTYLVIDEMYFNLNYGSDRSAVCEALPDVLDCPSIGFEVNFDTRRLTNGPHSLRIEAYDDNSAMSKLPASYGFAFTVKN